MLHSEFESQFVKLKLCYGDKAFPPIREQAFWLRYKNAPLSVFEGAVDWIVLTMPMLSQVMQLLDEKLRDTSRAVHKPDAFPEVPNAKDLAAKYAPGIRQLLKKGVGLPLPYDPKKRQA